jgi:site-specific DNA-methyltransferase (adenine-specific)
MPHLSENSKKLTVTILDNDSCNPLDDANGVEFILLPYFNTLSEVPNKEILYDKLNNFISQSNQKSTIVILTSPHLAVDYCGQITDGVNLKMWVAVKLKKQIKKYKKLNKSHASLLIFTKSKNNLSHTKTRIQYSYCPSCEKTTRDYGTKKHLYHAYGTLVSDVWKDCEVDFDDIPTNIIDRLSDLFAIPDYTYLNVYDWRPLHLPKRITKTDKEHTSQINCIDNSNLLYGDCVNKLKEIPDNSIDFCFADPPKTINGIEVSDDEYFNWCESWLSEISRVLKPGCTMAIIGTPHTSIYHFKFLSKILKFQDWIVWEGVNLPNRLIINSHHSILCFSKGIHRPLPAFTRSIQSLMENSVIETVKDGFCIRPLCVINRKSEKTKDTEPVSDMWWDINVLKNNTYKIKEYTQLPPMLMYRLISLFTNENEYVLDPFNGAGTTTLTAHQLNRNYIGIEKSELHYKISKTNHDKLEIGIDPFKKE